MQEIQSPFYSFTFELADGSRLHLPLQESVGMRFNGSTEQLAQVFAQRFQKKVLDKGDYEQLLPFYVEGHWEKDQIRLQVQSSRETRHYPDFEVEYPFFMRHTAAGNWLIVPQLQLELFVEEGEDLVPQLQNAILQALHRDQRLRYLQLLVASLWFEKVELEESRLSLKSYGLSELESLEEQNQERQLPKLADALQLRRKQLYGYEAQLKEALRALKSDYRQSLLLVGPTGVGKTTLVWELARKIKQQALGKTIWETTASALIKELTGDTGWQDQLARLCRELESGKDILFVRNLLALFEVGQYEGNEVSMGEYLRDFLSSGQLQIISECSEEELQRIETRSPNYSRFFRIIRLQPPKESAALQKIVLQKVQALAKLQKRGIASAAIEESLRLYQRYMPYSGFPGKPIRFLESLLLSDGVENKELLDRKTVIQAFCEETGMPAFMVDPDIPMPLQELRHFFESRLFGQQPTVDKMVDLLATVKTSMLPTEKPIASMLFVGPTGVGKTELAKVLADFMFGRREQVLRFDMSEYSNAYAVTRLTGTSYFSEGLLTAAVRRSPFAVVLFDELEKAHPSFYDLLLQILGEGRLSDSRGQLVNFCSTIVIMTSNIGAQKMQHQRIGWSQELQVDEVVQHFQSAVERHFRPELFNRIDQVLPFQPLSRESILRVVERELKGVLKREGIKHRKVNMQVAPAVYQYLGEKGYDSKYGARALQRSLQAELLLPLAQKLNQHLLDKRLEVKLQMRKNKLHIQVERDELGIEYFLEELTRNEYTDYASELRRRIQSLREGNFLTQVQSDLQRLEKLKHQAPQHFKKDYKNLTLYSEYLHIEQQISQLQAEISAYEEEMALVIMDLKPYDTRLHDAIDKWNQNYFEFKLQLYLQLRPSAKYAALLVLGKKAAKLLPLYQQILVAKEMQAKIKVLWNTDAGELLTSHEEQGLQPPQEGGSFIGIVFVIEGAAPYLYFSGEEGIHTWMSSNKEEKPELLEVECLELPSPNFDLKHIQLTDRPRLKRGNARRSYELEHLEDKLYGIARREVPRHAQWSFLTNLLDERFSLALDEVLQ